MIYFCLILALFCVIFFCKFSKFCFEQVSPKKLKYMERNFYVKMGRITGIISANAFEEKDECEKFVFQCVYDSIFYAYSPIIYTNPATSVSDWDLSPFQVEMRVAQTFPKVFDSLPDVPDAVDAVKLREEILNARYLQEKLLNKLTEEKWYRLRRCWRLGQSLREVRAEEIPLHRVLNMMLFYYLARKMGDSFSFRAIAQQMSLLFSKNNLE